MNPVTQTAQKCTLCYDRMLNGLTPACAKACRSSLEGRDSPRSCRAWSSCLRSPSVSGLGAGGFAGAAPADQRGAVVAVWVGAARLGQTIGPLAVGGLYGAIGTGTTFVVGGAVAAGIVVAEATGRFGDDRDVPLSRR